MLHSNSLMVASIVAAGLLLSACQKDLDAHDAEHPAVVEAIPDSDVKRVTLTERAAQRINLKTDEVRALKMKRSASLRQVVPYSSLIYDPQGQTWVYTSPQPRTFVRYKVEVDYIEGDMVVLKDGPPTGTVVASVGVAELYGTEFKVGH